MQKARTIDDHRTRYPQRVNDPRVDPLGGAGPNDELAPPSPMNPPASPSLSSGERSVAGLSESRSPVLDDIGGDYKMDIDPPEVEMPRVRDEMLLPAPQANARGLEAPVNADLDPELLAVAKELEREFRFDQLLDEDDQRRYDREDDGGDHHAELGFEIEDGIDNVDFGLPNEPNAGAGAGGAALPHFELRDDMEPEDLDHDPDDGDVLCKNWLLDLMTPLSFPQL
ncbi:hypothetical protein RhiJN_08993 [Ceratobasidium sp. AG-Ba]|nr:hypothetical protein RhiJN_08993 [Ceratobasidium sp. AG-Ba]QRW09772.1 hypothetical protein RhiLY_08771 [Ceratobasidium sp. AG-Ba]